jgi:hypothetical protein
MNDWQSHNWHTLYGTYYQRRLSGPLSCRCESHVSYLVRFVVIAFIASALNTAHRLEE